jgi:hypothetical protein
MRNKQLPERINYGDIEQSGGETVTIYESLFNQSERVNYGDQSESPPPEIITIYESLFNQSERVNYGDSEVIAPSQDLIIYANPMQPERINYGDGGSAIAADPSGLVFSSIDTITFDGTSNTYALRPSDLYNANISNTFTFLIKLKTSETTSRDQDIMNSSDAIEKPRFTMATGGVFTFYYTNGGLWYGQSSGSIIANTEYRLMVRITGLNTGSFHVNGVSQTTGIISGGASPAINFQKSYILGVSPPTNNRFKGEISYLKMFNRAITDAEATALGFL